jgi:hypothetical protein
MNHFTPALIKGEVPLLVSWTSTGKRVGDPNQFPILVTRCTLCIP